MEAARKKEIEREERDQQLLNKLPELCRKCYLQSDKRKCPMAHSKNELDQIKECQRKYQEALEKKEREEKERKANMVNQENEMYLQQQQKLIEREHEQRQKQMQIEQEMKDALQRQEREESEKLKMYFKVPLLCPNSQHGVVCLNMNCNLSHTTEESN